MMRIAQHGRVRDSITCSIRLAFAAATLAVALTALPARADEASEDSCKTGAVCPAPLDWIVLPP